MSIIHGLFAELRGRIGSALCSALLLTVFALPCPAAAQIGTGIESIFKDITDVSFTTSCWEADSNAIRETEECPFGQHAFGFEVSFRLKEIGLGGNTTTVTNEIKEIHHRNGSYDTIFVPKTTEKPIGPSVLLELGLGYSQFSGFRSTTDDYQIHGTLREIPAITLYASLLPNTGGFLGRFGGYAGFRTGLIQARDFQVTIPSSTSGDTVSVYQGEGQAFQIGWVLGGFFDVPNVPVSIFGERANMYRSLRSVRWAKDGAKIPDFVPEEIDFSGTTYSFGIQFRTK